MTGIAVAKCPQNLDTGSIPAGVAQVPGNPLQVSTDDKSWIWLVSSVLYPGWSRSQILPISNSFSQPTRFLTAQGQKIVVALTKICH
jgi:hypothetical protein